MTHKTLVIGASINPARYSYRCIHMLRDYGHTVEAIGLKPGKVADVEIQLGFPELKDIHTVTLYLGPANQPQYYDYVIGLKPQRVIFNPGAENDVFIELLEKAGIKTIENCTLVMLQAGIF